MKLSIITINWNNAEGLKKTIESVVLQKNLDFEYIVIDAESTDGSIEIIKQYENSITYWKSEPDSGIYNAMNKGIKQAQGDYCLFLNSGDWLKEQALSRILRQCTGEDIIYCNMYLSYDALRFQELKYPINLTLNDFYKTAIGHQSTFIKTHLFVKYGMYNENYKIHSDYDFWLKTIIIGNCSYKYIDEFLSYYDMGGRSSKPSKHTRREMKSILTQYFPKRVLDDYENWSKEREEMQIMYWVKSKKILYSITKIVFKMATKFVSLKKRIK